MSTDYSVTLARINQDAYESVLKMYEEQEPLIQQDLKNLGAFGTALNQRLNELQGGKVLVPSEEELKREELETLGTYWDLNATMVKTHELMHCLRGVMTLLNQPSRVLEQQARLDAHYPEVSASLTAVDTTAMRFFEELTSYYQHVDSIYQKMSKQMGVTSWEMMKFSDIVLNKGQPLSSFRLMYNYLGTPVVRKLTAEELAAPPATSGSDLSMNPVAAVLNSEPITSSVASSSTDTGTSSSTMSFPASSSSSSSSTPPKLPPKPASVTPVGTGSKGKKRRK